METKLTTISKKNEIRERIQLEAGNEAKLHHRCGLAISMGVGKTRIALQNMMALQLENNSSTSPSEKLKFLVVIPRVKIEKAYKDELELLSWTGELDITYTTYRSIPKQILSNFAKIYLDECHSLTWSVELPLKFYNGPILGLTGTPPSYPKSEKGHMVKTYCPIVYTYMTDEAVDDEVLNKFKMFVHPISLNPTSQSFIIKYKNGGQKRTSEMEDYISHSKNIEFGGDGSFQHKQMARIYRLSSMKKYSSKINYLTHNLIPRLAKGNFKYLIFCNTQEQADLLADPRIGSYHANNKDSEENYNRFCKLDKGYMTCVDQIKEGVTIPGLNSVVIMHAYGNERNASQKIGRMLRLSPEDTAIGHILMYRDTVDQTWVKAALSKFHHERLKLFLPETNQSYPLMTSI